MSATQTIALMSDRLAEDEFSMEMPGARETMRHTYFREQPGETLVKEIIGRGTKPMVAGLCAAGIIAGAPAQPTRSHGHEKPKTSHATKVKPKVKAKVHKKRVKIKLRKRRHVPLNTYSGPIDENPMAVTTWMEARNQPRVGRLAVMHVIKNRVEADKKMFGKGLRGVCHKPWQYSAWNRNDDSQRVAFFNMLQLPEYHPEKILWRNIQHDAKEVWSGRHQDNTHGATYYHTDAVHPKWRYDMKVVGIIKDHIFYRPMTTSERKLRHRDNAANRKLKNARRAARKAHGRQVVMTISIRYGTRTSQAVPMAVRSVKHHR